MSSHARAGMLAAVAGLLAFLVIHHFWILPIWFVAPLGLPLALLGGLAVGRAYGELDSALPPRPWRHLAWLAGTAVTLAPSVVLAELRPALFDVATGDLAPGTGLDRVVATFGLELLVPATVIGAALGALVGRSRRAALACAVAGFAFALGPGHNIPLVGGTPGAVKGTVLLAATVAVATVVLVEAHARRAA